MAAKFSTGLRDYMMATGAFNAIMDLGFLDLYSGAVPATADDTIGAGQLLCRVSVSGGGTGLTFEPIPANGVMSKAAIETWQGPIILSGTASFFRFVTPADTGGAVPAEQRIQGLVGVLNADLILTNTSLVSPGVQTINHFNVGLPTL